MANVIIVFLFVIRYLWVKSNTYFIVYFFVSLSLYFINNLLELYNFIILNLFIISWYILYIIFNQTLTVKKTFCHIYNIPYLSIYLTKSTLTYTLAFLPFLAVQLSDNPLKISFLDILIYNSVFHMNILLMYPLNRTLSKFLVFFFSNIGYIALSLIVPNYFAISIFLILTTLIFIKSIKNGVNY
jgi:hypothetical protein